MAKFVKPTSYQIIDPDGQVRTFGKSDMIYDAKQALVSAYLLFVYGEHFPRTHKYEYYRQDLYLELLKLRGKRNFTYRSIHGNFIVKTING